MKKITILCVALFSTNAIARTIDWYVDGQIYQTTSCEYGDSITPPTPPAKYGYTFQYWNDPGIIEGTGIQSGTPTPTNPIYPTFYQNGDLILRSVASGNNRVFDTYNPSTGKITRRIGVKVLKGTESWDIVSAWSTVYTTFRSFTITNDISIPSDATAFLYCSHFAPAPISSATRDLQMDNTISLGSAEHAHHTLWIRVGSFNSVADFKQWLADEYANGTPVTIYYPLATPVEENYVPNQQ